MKNRRTDNELRDKINELRRFLHSRRDLQGMLEATLKTILHFIPAEFGLLANIRLNSQQIISTHDPICFKRPALSDGELEYIPQKIVSIGSWTNLSAKGNIIRGRPVILNAPISNADKSGMPSFLQPLENVLILPLLSLNNCFAVILLANYQPGFQNSDVQRLWPILSCCGLIYRTQSTSMLNQTVVSKMDVATDELTKLAFVNHDAIITVDENQNVIRFNPSAEKMFRIAAHDAIGQSLEQFIPSNFQNNHRLKLWNAAYTQLEPQKKIAYGITANGEEVSFHYEIFIQIIGQQSFTTYVLQNITTQLEIKRQHQEALTRLKAITDLAPVGILQVDEKWNTSYVNESWCMLTGMSLNEANGQGWVSAIHPADAHKTLSSMREELSQLREFGGDVKFLNPIGQISVVQTRAKPLMDQFGKLNGFLATFVDVTALRITEQKLRNLAERDSLTGLSNRNTFMEKLQSAIDRSHRRGPISLVYLDLDGFKHINDTMGHDAGDKLLKTVAERIQLHMRKEDTVARLGGDEFTLILEAMHDPTFAAETVNNILKRIAQPIIIDQQSIYISASAGISIGGENSQPKQLLRQADTALYKAKALGRNNYQYFTEEMTVAAERRLLLHNELHSAVENQEFCVYFQPQFDLRNNSIIGNEALIRWNHPQNGLCAPDSFLHMLEESKLIIDIGAWILEAACQQHAYWLKQRLLAKHCTISVNISAIQFYQFDISNLVKQVLQKTHLPSQNLCLEITESVLMKNVKKCTDELSALKNLGIKVSLDDFGKGYSSLNQLCQLPIDQIKLDQSFVDNLFNDPKTATVSRSVIALGRELNLQVIAEGIDNQEKLVFLRNHGCDFGQGYYFSQARFADDLPEFFKSVANEKQKRSLGTVDL